MNEHNDFLARLIDPENLPTVAESPPLNAFQNGVVALACLLHRDRYTLDAISRLAVDYTDDGYWTISFDLRGERKTHRFPMLRVHQTEIPH